MMNVTPELIAKARAAKSAEELLALAMENGIALTEEDAKTCFEQLHTNGALSDDELEAVSGGGICDFFAAFLRMLNIVETNSEACASSCGNATPAVVTPSIVTPGNATPGNVTHADVKPGTVTLGDSITTLPYNSTGRKKTGRI